LSRIEEDGRKRLRKPKLCTKNCRAVLRRRSRRGRRRRRIRRRRRTCFAYDTLLMLP